MTSCSCLRVIDDPVLVKESIVPTDYIIKTHRNKPLSREHFSNFSEKLGITQSSFRNSMFENVESCECGDSILYLINDMIGNPESPLFASKGDSNGDGNYGSFLYKNEINYIDHKQNNVVKFFKYLINFIPRILINKDFDFFPTHTPISNFLSPEIAIKSRTTTNNSDTIHIAVFDSPVSYDFVKNVADSTNRNYKIINEGYRINNNQDTDHGKGVVKFLIEELISSGNTNPVVIHVFDVVHSINTYPVVSLFDVLCAFYNVIDYDIDYVNMSFGFQDSIPLFRNMLREVTTRNEDLIITSSAGNNKIDLEPLHIEGDHHYPSQYYEINENIHQVVGSEIIDNNIEFWGKTRFTKKRGSNRQTSLSNSDSASAVVDSTGNGGTSFAAPRFLARRIISRERN